MCSKNVYPPTIYWNFSKATTVQCTGSVFIEDHIENPVGKGEHCPASDETRIPLEKTIVLIKQAAPNSNDKPRRINATMLSSMNPNARALLGSKEFLYEYYRK